MADRAKRLGFAALPALLLLAGTPALASDWRLAFAVDSNPQFGRSIAFVDRDSIARNGDLIDFVYEVRFERARIGNDPLEAMRVGVRADCTAYWYEIGWLEGFRGTETVARSGSSPRTQAEPGSNVHNVITAACRDSYQSGTIDPATQARTHFGTPG